MLAFNLFVSTSKSKSNAVMAQKQIKNDFEEETLYCSKNGLQQDSSHFFIPSIKLCLWICGIAQQHKSLIPKLPLSQHFYMQMNIKYVSEKMSLQSFPSSQEEFN